jgi:tRNA pseudouridine55 synthase
VARVRRLLRLKRVGHGGTLDPAATGVLPIALGRATRLLQFLSDDKAYRATVRFGVQTATDDLEGVVLHAQPVPWLTLEAVKARLPQFLGKIQQVPPRYSAIQVQGKRLYDLARAGVAIEVPIRTVEVYAIEVLGWQSGDFPELSVTIACGAGTYIRSLARDLGEVLQVGGTLASLTRTLSSSFHLADSITLEELAAQAEQKTFAPIAPTVGLQHLAAVTLPAAEAQRWCRGQRLLIEELSIAPASPSNGVLQVCRVHDQDGNLLGVGEQRLVEHQWLLVPQVVVWEG